MPTLSSTITHSFMPPLEMDEEGNLLMRDKMAIGAVIDRGPCQGKPPFNGLWRIGDCPLFYRSSSQQIGIEWVQVYKLFGLGIPSRCAISRAMWRNSQAFMM